MIEGMSLLDRYNSVRKQTVGLTEGLNAEDLCVQSMADASPGKWHLAHTTWFFETFILQNHDREFRWFDQQFNYLFNSYYNAVGERHARVQRGLLTRPSFQSVLDYREHVDERVRRVLAHADENAEYLVTIGLHHEMQHQELFLTDLLHLLSHNPLSPAIFPRQKKPIVKNDLPAAKMSTFDGGFVDVGQDHQPGLFSYDCEQPRHKTYIHPFKMSTRLVSNGEWLEFMDDSGYANALLWLSDGWDRKNKENWQAPMYWQKQGEHWYQYGLDGLHPVDFGSPVCHVSYYEAHAFAHWAGKRLPKEHEWETVAANRSVAGNFLESYSWRPNGAHVRASEFADIFGDVWEWTQSSFSPYPGFHANQGALGEYNGKFMSNQYVLKGGSCATPRLQMRASYRNFFYPHQRWQFMGLRLAEDS